MATRVCAEVTGSVWEVVAQPGARVAAGDVLLVIESMKMEIPVEAPRDGVVSAVLLAKGDAVTEGQAVAVLE